MATLEIAGDYRRTDQRTNVLENPFWLTSGIVNCGTCTAKAAMLFSFPVAGQIIIVQEVAVQNIVAATAGNTVDIGSGTLATNAVTTGGVVTIVDADEYFKTADYAVTAGAWAAPTTGNTSDWLTAAIAKTGIAAPRCIIGAATTVPCVYATIGTATAGTFRVHMLVTILPGT
jgi:hypothetical protein